MVNNECPNLKEEDLKDFRFAHLHDALPENYNLVIFYPEMMLDKKASIDFLKNEGLF
jgi:hypothetical protein